MEGSAPRDPLDGRDAVVETLEELCRELEAGARWENDTLPRFLDAFAALLGSIERVYLNAGRVVPSDPWVLMVAALRGACEYE